MNARWCGRTFFLLEEIYLWRGPTPRQGPPSWIAELYQYKSIYTSSMDHLGWLACVSNISWWGPRNTFWHMSVCGPTCVSAVASQLCKTQIKDTCGASKGAKLWGWLPRISHAWPAFCFDSSMKLYRCVAESKMKASFKAWVLSNP